MKSQKQLFIKIIVCLLLVEGSLVGEVTDFEKKKVPQIIFLNGACSAGKTTVARMLQEKLDEPFLHIGVDSMVHMMPEKVNDWDGGRVSEGFWGEAVEDGSNKPRMVVRVGPFAKKVLHSFGQVVLTLIRDGHSVIVEDVASERCYFERWREVLKGCNVLWVGIKVSLEELEKREKERGDRLVGSSREQYFKIHQGFKYDVVIDETQESLEKSISKIVRLVQGKERFDQHIDRKAQ